ncbi:MAG: stage III sporulation protein AC [Bacillota bacterium]
MSVDLVFRIAAIGMLVAVLHQLLVRAGREDMATMTTIAGLVIVLLMVVDLISNLFDNIKRIFGLY